MAKLIKTFLTTIMAAVLCAAIITYCMSVASAKNVSAVTTPEITETTEAQAELSVEDQLFYMLNMNYCYGATFDDASFMAQRAAIVLSDYADEVDGVGFCVNASLVSEFMSAFYGVAVEAEEICSDDVQGIVAIPNAEMGEMVHTPVSITESNGEITVVSCMEIYFGGDDMETFLAKSKFKANPDSPFGYNLIFSEIL